MTALAYPASFRREGDVFTVMFPDFEEAHTQGSTRAEAFQMASDCLYTAIEWRMERKAEIPVPSSSKRGQVSVPVPLDLAPKVALFQAMRERGMTNVALAKNLNVSENVIRRMLNPSHKSKPDQYMRALFALGHALETSVVPIGGQTASRGQRPRGKEVW